MPRVLFQKGQSGNPGGRPKLTEAQKQAREHTVQAIQTLVAMLENPKQAVAAAVALLDRGWGKPAQEVTGADGGPLTMHTYVIRAATPIESAGEWLRLHAPSDSRKQLTTDT
jgi:hypothetical protein